MDLTTALIGLGLVVLATIPFIYFYYAGKAEKQKFVDAFMNLARQQQATISQYEVWSHYAAIGLDTGTNKLFFYKKQDDKEQRMFLNLAEVEKCRVVVTKKMLNEDQVIDRLELAFSLRNARHAEDTILFYSKEESMTLNDELQLAEKWKNIISSQLETKRKLAAAS